MKTLARSLAALIAPLAAALVILPATAPVAFAQNVVAMVNRKPITSFDVAQRIRIAAMIDRRRLDSRGALEDLIDDQVKLNEARKAGYRVTDEGVDAEFQRLARSNRQSESEFSAGLRKSGLEPNALRDKIRSDIAWNALQRDQVRRGSQITNADIDRELESGKSKKRDVIDYQLQSVIFVVPQGGGAGERQRAAAAARTKFTSCETGFDEMRTMRDVAVRPAVLRSTETMNDQLVALLAKTPVGRLTPPFPSDQGIEMVAVCERKPRNTAAAARAEVASSLADKRVNENAKSYLTSLRKNLDIRYIR